MLFQYAHSSRNKRMRKFDISISKVFDIFTSAPGTTPTDGQTEFRVFK